MFRLRTFGGLTLESDGVRVPEINAQRKALALLAVLARSGEAGIGREKLMALLWPDSDMDRARGALKQMLHGIRRQLDTPDVITGTSELFLNRNILSSDVAEFSDAIARGDLGEAVSRYRGPFLDAVHVDRAPEFSRWQDAERAELAHAHLDALERLARAADESGSRDDAVNWWRQLSAADPLQSRGAVGLMRSLEAAGDRSGALRIAEQHQALLRDELEAKPDAEVAALAARLRSTSVSFPQQESSVVSGRIAEARLLAKKPEDRPQSAADVLAVLDRIGTSKDTAVVTQTPRARRVPRSVGAAAIILALVVAGYGSFALVRGARAKTIAAVPASKSVAVLPFTNTSGDAESEHFSNGLTDELISALGQIQGLKVIARTSVFALKNKGLGVRAIADSLGVTTLIEGSARRDGKRLIITAQLVGAADGAVVWSEKFDRQMVDVFSVQEEIARAIVGALNIHLTPSARSRLASRRTTDIEVYDLYLKGRNHWGKRTRKDMELALEYFQNALHRDPRFAPAYADMANTYVAMSNLNYVPVEDGLTRAGIAANHAIALDSTLGEAHAARGFVLASSQAFAESERELRRAIELNPSYSSAHHFYSLLLTMLNRGAEAVEQNQITLALDPLLIPALGHRGVLLCLAGRYADARRDLERGFPLTKNVPFAPFFLGAVEAHDGRYATALNYLETAQKISPRYTGVSGAIAYTYAHMGRRAESDSIRDRLRRVDVTDRSRIEHALAEAVMGDIDSAFAILEKPTKWNVPDLIELRADPLLVSFRADPRYPRLLAAIGLRP